MIKVYFFKDFSRDIVYIGKTNDLKKRRDEHLNKGKKFYKIKFFTSYNLGTKLTYNN